MRKQFWDYGEKAVVTAFFFLLIILEKGDIVKRKILCMFLCVFLSMNLFVIDISASEVEPVENWSDGNWEKIIDFLTAKNGIAVSDKDAAKVGVGTWIYKNRTEKLFDLFNTFKAGVSLKNGKVLVSSQAMNALKGMTDAYIEDCGDYFYAPTFSYSDVSTDINQFSFKVYQRFLQDVGNEWTFIYFSSKSYYFMHIDADQMYFVGNPGVTYNNYAYLVDLNGDYTESDTYYLRENSQSVNPEKTSFGYNDRVTFPFAKYPDQGYRVVTPTGRPVKVWKTQGALRAYLRGLPSPNTTVYVSSVYNNYNTSNDNSIEINKEILNNYIFNDNSTITQDLSQIINDVTNTINNYYVTNGTTMTQTDIQIAIDAALQKFYDSLPSGGGTTDPDPDPDPDNPGGDVSGNDPTVSGNDVSGNGVDGPLTVGWLEKIYNKLVDIFNFLKGGLMDALEGIKGAITDIADTVSNNSVSGNTPGTDPDVGDMMSQAQEAATPAAELLKTKFPTCIPWDVINVFNVLVADPSPPVYEIPIDIPSVGVSETLTIDLSVYDTVFKISRSLIAVLFALLLMRFTVALTKGGDS